MVCGVTELSTTGQAVVTSLLAPYERLSVPVSFENFHQPGKFILVDKKLNKKQYQILYKHWPKETGNVK